MKACLHGLGLQHDKTLDNGQHRCCETFQLGVRTGASELLCKPSWIPNLKCACLRENDGQSRVVTVCCRADAVCCIIGQEPQLVTAFIPQ